MFVFIRIQKYLFNDKMPLSSTQMSLKTVLIEEGLGYLPGELDAVVLHGFDAVACGVGFDHDWQALGTLNTLVANLLWNCN